MRVSLVIRKSCKSGLTCNIAGENHGYLFFIRNFKIDIPSFNAFRNILNDVFNARQLELRLKFRMVTSALMQQNRDEQRQEMMKKTPGERLMIALELSDVCLLLGDSAREALEKKRATAKA